MEVPVVAIPRLHFVQPRAITAGIPAERFLDCRIHEYAGHIPILRRGLYQRHVRWCPYPGIDILAVFAHDHGRHHLFPVLPRELAVGHGSEPDIDVKTNLVAGVTPKHGATAWLRHVADEEPAPSRLRRLAGQSFQKFNELGVSPVAIA